MNWDVKHIKHTHLRLETITLTNATFWAHGVDVDEEIYILQVL